MRRRPLVYQPFLSPGVTACLVHRRVTVVIEHEELVIDYRNLGVLLTGSTLARESHGQPPLNQSLSGSTLNNRALT
jgi:hypothetical protein